MLKKLVEEVKAKKSTLKQKVVEWEETYDKVKNIANEQADKLNKLGKTNEPIIQQLLESVKQKDS